MILRNFLETLKTDSIQITVIDNNAELISFKASGYQYLEDILESREIKEWYIVNPMSVKVSLIPETTN